MKRFSLAIVSCALLSLLLVPISPVHAEDTSIGNEYPGLLRGVRPLGMGNAFSSMTGTDYHAQFYNPAAINDYEKKYRFTILSPGAQFNTGLFGMISDVRDLKNNIDAAAADADKIRVFNTFVQSHAGQYHQITTGFPIFHMRHKYFATGIIVDGRVAISLRDRSFSSFEVKGTGDAGWIGGGAYGFFDEKLQVGGNLKVLYRHALEEKITIGDILNQSLGQTFGYSAWKKGIGVGVDLGGKYQLPIWEELLNPTLSLVLQDVGHTRFTGGAPKQRMSLTAGAGIFPKFGKFQLAVLTDFRELSEQEDFLKKLHFGGELRFPEYWHTTFSLRLGTNQGYLATGFSLEWPVVSLHGAYYGEELGEVSRQRSSYRLAGQLVFSF